MAELGAALGAAGVRDIVDLRIDFIVQNTTDARTYQCHDDDGWGPSKADPAGREGIQDCLLDRYQLCARHGVGAAAGSDWFDFTTCVYRNQAATGTTTDGMRAFNLTVAYCAAASGQDSGALARCAEGPEGLALLHASHAVDRAVNHHTYHPPQNFHTPDWVIVDGADLQGTNASMLAAICDAYAGPKPAGCAAA